MQNNRAAKVVLFAVVALMSAPPTTAADQPLDSPIDASGTPAIAQADVSLPNLIRQYSADASSVESCYKLPWSTLRFERLDRLYSDWLARLDGLNFDALSQSDRVDYVLFKNELLRSRRSLERSRKRLAEIDDLIGFRDVIQNLNQARWREGQIDGPAAATSISELAAQVKVLRKRIEKSAASGSTNARPRGGDKRHRKRARTATNNDDAQPLAITPALALRAAEAVAALRHTLREWFTSYEGFNPELVWWVKTPCEEADKQLEAYGKLLKEEVAGQKGGEDDPLVGDPIGAAAVAEDIRFEFLPYTAQELIALGERELAWGERQMKGAAREMGHGDDWKAAMAQVKADYVPPGQQDDLVAEIGREAIEFVKQHKFATIPPLCEETWRLSMIPVDKVQIIPYAAYKEPKVLVAYANERMTQEDKRMIMRGNNRAFVRLTTIHELIPGHHLQSYIAARYNTHRNLFRTPFYTEGWGLYCELRLWDLGWARTPQERIGMLFWRMSRAARVIVALKFHLGEMTPTEIADFFVKRIGHERLGAMSEVRRLISEPPLYQASYLLGGMQIAALHDELVNSGRKLEQQFNDAVLAANTMPIELLRAMLSNLPVTRDMKPVWRFAARRRPDAPGDNGSER